jgi:hypothetical protein
MAKARASGKFLQIIARALWSEHEQFPLKPKGKTEERIFKGLVENGYLVTEPFLEYAGGKWIKSGRVFYRPAPWLRKFSL